MILGVVANSGEVSYVTKQPGQEKTNNQEPKRKEENMLMKNTQAIISNEEINQDLNKTDTDHKANSKKRTASEIFASISSRIRQMYDNQITEAESRQAARNFINFCQLIIDCNLKQQRRMKEDSKTAEKNEE